MNDYTFRSSNFFPFTIGFDRPLKVLEALTNVKAPSYPPYNIIKIGDENYTIELAIAGFNSKDEVDVSVKDNVLYVVGSKVVADDSVEYLYQGIAARDFRREFTLADNVEVTGAELKDGILTISLHRRIPEEMKPRQIPVIK